MKVYQTETSPDNFCDACRAFINVFHPSVMHGLYDDLKTECIKQTLFRLT